MLRSQRVLKRKYWFREEDLAEPIDWAYLGSLSERVQVALEVYMEGKVSLGRASEMAGLSVRAFDEIRGKARIPVNV